MIEVFFRYDDRFLPSLNWQRNSQPLSYH